MSIFSKRPKVPETPAEEEISQPPAEESVPCPPEPEYTPVYDEEGYDERGFDRDGYSRNGYDAKGYRRDVGLPLDTSAKLEDEILKYRRANGYFEYELAVYANFPDLKDNFEPNHESVADLVCNLFLIDEGYALRLWKWLLVTFESTLPVPANAYRIVSGVLYALDQQGVAPERLLPFLQKDAQLSQLLFEKPSYVDKRHAALLAACLTENDLDLFGVLMDFFRSNPYPGREETPSADKILKTVIEDVPAPSMTHEIYDLLSKCIKKSVKTMMRKVLFKLLDQKMEYLLNEEKRKQAEAERAARLEEQRLRLEEESLSRQKEAGVRQSRRTTKKKYVELKAAAIAQHKEEPLWEGGRFVDFLQLEGTMVALKAHPEIPGQLLPGDRLELRREPYYLQDPMAIAVIDLEGTKIGYIPNHSNTFLAILIDEGRELFGRLYSIGSEDADSLQICVEIFLKD